MSVYGAYIRVSPEADPAAIQAQLCENAAWHGFVNAVIWRNVLPPEWPSPLRTGTLHEEIWGWMAVTDGPAVEDVTE